MECVPTKPLLGEDRISRVMCWPQPNSEKYLLVRYACQVDDLYRAADGTLMDVHPPSISQLGKLLPVLVLVSWVTNVKLLANEEKLTLIGLSSNYKVSSTLSDHYGREKLV